MKAIERIIQRVKEYDPRIKDEEVELYLIDAMARSIVLLAAEERSRNHCRRNFPKQWKEPNVSSITAEK